MEAVGVVCKRPRGTAHGVAQTLSEQLTHPKLGPQLGLTQQNERNPHLLLEHSYRSFRLFIREILKRKGDAHSALTLLLTSFLGTKFIHLAYSPFQFDNPFGEDTIN